MGPEAGVSRGASPLPTEAWRLLVASEHRSMAPNTLSTIHGSRVGALCQYCQEKK